MRCENCAKFVSYEDPPTAELQSVEKDGSDGLRATVRVALLCAECSNELKESEIETEAKIEHECKLADKRKTGDPVVIVGSDEQYEIEADGDPEGTSRREAKTPKGKLIPGRYQKQFYGFELSTTVKCNCCGESFDVEIKDDQQASHFDEL